MLSMYVSTTTTSKGAVMVSVRVIISNYLEALGLPDNDEHVARGIEQSIMRDSVGMYRLVRDEAEEEVAQC